MISRTTLGAFLLALLIPSGLSFWTSGHPDSCARYLAGDKSLPATQMVSEGTQMVEVSCRQWIPRQPLAIQLTCLVELVVLMVFGLHAIGDVLDGIRMRREGVAGDEFAEE